MYRLIGISATIGIQYIGNHITDSLNMERRMLYVYFELQTAMFVQKVLEIRMLVGGR